MNKLKVLHVINSLQPGGAENLLVNSLAPGGLQQYADNTVAFFAKGSYLQTKLDPDVKVYDLGYKGWWNLSALLSKLRKIIVRGEYNIVHSHLSPAGLYTELVIPSSISHVHTIHTTYSLDVKNKCAVRNLIEKKLFLQKTKTKLIAISDFNKKDILNNVKLRGTVHTVHNFIDEHYFQNYKTIERDPNKLKIIAIGNLRIEKNYEYLIEIFKYLKEYHIYLDVYGNGDLIKYQKLLDEYEITNIESKGGNQHIHSIITNYDLFIIASEYEGFGLSVFGAMASGVPVLLSDIPSLRNLVNEHAFYFPLDNPKAVAEILVKIFQHQIDIQSPIENAKLYAEKIAKRERYINDIMNLYNSLIQKNSTDK